jgi:hypothetical protein
MKLTTKKLYKLIQEELLNEVAKGIQSIPKDAHIVCATLKNKNGFVITLKTQGAPNIGSIGWIQFENIPNKFGNCLDGMTISMSLADQGWGPFLYDLVMEKASIESAGIIPDRTIVSEKARSVWQYYLDNREGIVIRQLDDLNDSFDNGPQDDCAQVSSQQHRQMNWKKSPLSKIYSKNPTTIEALKKIKWIDDKGNEKIGKWTEIEL